MNSRAMTMLLFFLAALVLFTSLTWVVLAYVLPRPRWVEIGRLEDFPPSQEPYPIQRQVYVFLVNDGQEIVVLDPLNPAEMGTNVRWNAVEQAFIDPVRGSWFNVSGMPMRRAAVNSIVESQSLRRFDVKVDHGLIFIDLHRSQVVKLTESQLP